jgi:hypothetical protein
MKEKFIARGNPFHIGSIQGGKVQTGAKRKESFN